MTALRRFPAPPDFAAVAGKMTDHAAAAHLGVSRKAVLAYRLRHGIPSARYGADRKPPDPKALRRWLAGQWEPVTTRTVAEHLGIGEDGATTRLREAGALRVGRWPSLWVAP